MGQRTTQIKLALGAAVAIALTGPARAADPVALVEDVGGTVAGVEAMDLLRAGTVVRLPTGAVLTLGYFRSCLREVITGGVVTIGTERSEVQGSTIARERVPCDTGRQTTSDQSRPGGVAVFRGAPRTLPAADLTLHAAIPLIDMGGAGTLVIERLDQTEPRATLQVPAVALRAGWFDLARAGLSLVPGGLYRITAPKGSLVVRVSAEAGPPRSALSRMVRFGPVG
jgi:hypothetical protein